MADTPPRTDTPPPPPRPPERTPSPEMQQRLADFRAQKEARQDAGLAVDHREKKAENLAARETARNTPKADNAGRAAQGGEGAERQPQRSDVVAPQQRRAGANESQQRPPEGAGRDNAAAGPSGLRQSPELQQRQADFRAQKEARQDAGLAVDHREKKAENLAARETARNTAKTDGAAQRPQGAEGAEKGRRDAGTPPAPRVGEGAQPHDAVSRNNKVEPAESRASPEFQQKLAEIRAQKEARQDAGSAVDHRENKAENAAVRAGNEVDRKPNEGVTAPQQRQRAEEAIKPAETRREGGTSPSETKLAEPAASGGRDGDRPVDTRPATGDGGDRRTYAAKHLDPAADLRKVPGEQNPDSETGAEHHRDGAGAGSGPWFDDGTNHREGGAVKQVTDGSCVSAAGEMVSDGRVSQGELHSRLGDWSNPMSLRNELNDRDGGGWQGHYFASGEDAARKAAEGPMAAVVQAPHGSAHMVMLDSRSDGTFTVRDPYEGSSYDVDRHWVETYVSAGVWRE